MHVIDPVRMLRPRRKITGLSAILLPFTESGDVDWAGFDAHVIRTADAALTPAVNMDTGFGNLLDEKTRTAVLDRTRAVLGGRPFVAGAFGLGFPGEPFSDDTYAQSVSRIVER